MGDGASVRMAPRSLVDRVHAAFNARDLAGLQELLDPRVELVMSGTAVSGRRAVADFMKLIVEAHPGLRMECPRIFAEAGDAFVTEMTLLGAGIAGAAGGPAEQSEISACALYRAVEDRIVEWRIYQDPTARALASAALIDVAAEQSALRRVAELVARHPEPQSIFDLVTDELRRLLHVDIASTVRFEPGDRLTVMALRAESDDLRPGMTVPITPGMVVAEVRRTRGPARIDEPAPVPGPAGSILEGAGADHAAAGPITVDDEVWGAMVVASSDPGALPPGVEHRVAQFAEFVSTAISNLTAQQRVSQLAAEQAALLRVATLVASEYEPEELFDAVAREIGQLLDVDATAILRYGPDESATTVAAWSAGDISIERGMKLPLDGENLASDVLRSGRPHRREDYRASPGEIAEAVRSRGIRSSVACPIIVRGEIWGVIGVMCTRATPPAPGTEQRLTEFSRHAAMAIANANSRAELARSRARLVRAADEARRRFERDLHDGVQQRLVSLAMELGAAEAALPADLDEPRQVLAEVAAGLREALDDLRELSRGLHPTVLSEAGLAPALRSLARRSTVPVKLRLDLGAERLPEEVEVAAYYAVSEALTNTAKHAEATRIDVRVGLDEGGLRLTISDDGRGGADPGDGSGLTGLADRVEAIGGTFGVQSPPGTGTTIRVSLPMA